MNRFKTWALAGVAAISLGLQPAAAGSLTLLGAGGPAGGGGGGLTNPFAIYSGTMSGSTTTWTGTTTADCHNTDLVVVTATVLGTTITGVNVGATGLTVSSADNDGGSPTLRSYGEQAVLAADRLTGVTVTITTNVTPTQAVKAQAFCLPSANAYQQQNSGSGAGANEALALTPAVQPQYLLGFATYNKTSQSYTTPGGWTSLGNTGTGIGDIYSYWKRITSTTATNFNATNSNSTGNWIGLIMGVTSD